jgi:hypothetical protein
MDTTEAAIDRAIERIEEKLNKLNSESRQSKIIIWCIAAVIAGVIIIFRS